MLVNQGERIELFQNKSNIPENIQNLLDRDSNVFYHQLLSTPVFNSISHAKGAYLFDGKGNEILDLHGNGVHTVGYNNPRVIEALRNQIDKELTFSPRRYTNLESVLLAEKLVSISPKGLDNVLFAPGGSQAIEMAITLAKHYTGKWKTVSYYGTFHGSGFQAISLGADAHFYNGLGPIVPGALHLEIPDYYRNPWGMENTEQIDNEYLRQLKVILENNKEVAALVSEPIFYNSTVPTSYYWTEVKALCEKYSVLLIFDEIYTGFGRTGKMFASEHFVTPDIMVVGKGFSGGFFPYAGIVGSSDLNVLNNKSIGHYTHEKNPLCATVCSAVIDTVIEENIVEKTKTLGLYFKEGLYELQEQFNCIGNVTGLGLNIGVDIVEDKKSKKRDVKKATRIMQSCLEQNIAFKIIQGNILNIKPSLVITKDEIDNVLAVLKEVLLKTN